MNYSRASVFGVVAALFSFALTYLLAILPVALGGFLAQYIFFLIFFIPFLLLLTKWYFRSVPASFKQGLLLGLWSTGVSVGVYAIIFSIFMGLSAGFVFSDLIDLFYSSGFIIFICTLLAVTVFAGWEFDTTYTKPVKK